MFSRFLAYRLLCLLALLDCAHITPASAQTANVLTNVSQIADLMKTNVRVVSHVHLTAVVYGTDRVHAGFAVRDETGLIWLQIENLPDAVKMGSCVSIDGAITTGRGHAFIGKCPIIEGEYYSDTSEQSCGLYLAAGKHPLEVLFHHESHRAILDLSYQGPGVTPKIIPNSAFWRSATNAAGGFVPGLHYDCYKGYTTEYPDFTDLKPDLSGDVGNLFARFFTSGSEKNTDAAERKVGVPNSNFVLRFCGFLQIDQPGFYQFTSTANNGERFTLDYDARYHIAVTGHTNLASPEILTPSQAWGHLPEPVWSQIEGMVTEVGEFDGQLQMELRGDTGPMKVIVAGGNIEASSMLLNSRVRVTGLAYSAVTMHGGSVVGKILVPGVNEVAILKVSEACWQTFPDGTIGELTKRDLTNLDSAPIHIRGTITRISPGKSFMLKDGTGEIEVRNSGIEAGQSGQAVDVLGLAQHSGKKAMLRYSIFRPQASTNEFLPVLTSIEQIRRIKETDKTSNSPVRIKAVVTQVVNDGLEASIRGDSEGIAVYSSTPQPLPLHMGDLCEFEGHIEWDKDFPKIDYSKVTILGPGQLPEPLHPTINELLNGSVDNQWVEMQGVVLSVLPTAGVMTIGVPGGEVKIQFSHSSMNLWSPYLRSVVRVRGIAVAFFGKGHRPESAALRVNSPLDISIVTPSPDNLFNLPAKQIPDLLTFDPNASDFPFVKVTGQVVFARESTFYLMSGTNGIHFTTTDKPNFKPGDKVNVVGIPDNDRLSPNLNRCSAKLIGHATLPPPLHVAPARLSGDLYESTLVQVETTLLGVTAYPNEQVLELQLTSGHVLLARLDVRRGSFPALLPQSTVRITGVFTSTTKKDGSAPELLINSPGDLTVLHTPPWWNLQRSITVLTLMGLVLVLAISWISTLRKRVERRTSELQHEIVGHKRTEVELNEKTGLLQSEIEERKRIQIEVENIHRQLVDASRQAGQAEVAINVLHNVGNVLNSVNISATIASDRLRKLRPGNIAKAADLLEKRSGAFSLSDEKDQQLLVYLRQIAAHLEGEQGTLVEELRGLRQNIEHIKEIVVTQQAYAKRIGVFERFPANEIVENALKVHSAAYDRNSIRVVRDYKDVPEVTLDKHKVLQILVNFLQNARHACEESGKKEKIVTVCIQSCPEERFSIQVTDNGAGIAAENMPNIFTHGFTTRPDGHGFGLHSAALAAKEMGGSLTFHSEGVGKGATFILELPMQPISESVNASLIETAA